MKSPNFTIISLSQDIHSNMLFLSIYLHTTHTLIQLQNYVINNTWFERFEKWSHPPSSSAILMHHHFGIAPAGSGAMSDAASSFCKRRRRSDKGLVYNFYSPIKDKALSLNNRGGEEKLPHSNCDSYFDKWKWWNSSRLPLE